MARDTTDSTLVSGTEDLIAHLAEGNKPKEQFRIGTEHEKFVFHLADKSPVPYEGETGIRALLEGVQARLGWEPIVDGGNIIGLGGPDGQGAISLEPGGQFELSGAALPTLHDTAAEAQAHIALTDEIGRALGLGFLGMGGSPKWQFSETPRMPKSRYQIMTRYMPKVGSQGLDMMYRTSTIQVNLDFGSETDMRRKMLVGMKLQSLATALFASSPFTNGKPNGLKSWRGDIWRDTDNNRAGLLPFVFSPDFGFADYAEWALDVPMYFVVRDGKYHDCTHVTFRQFMNGALKGEVADAQPNMGDWTNHLSTLFPDVRLKRFLEMRGADSGPLSHIPALSAFWVGLLYDEAALADAETAVSDWSFDEVQALRDSVPAAGLAATIKGRALSEIAGEILQIAERGLKNRANLNSSGQDESIYLGPLQEMVKSGATLADRMLTEWAENADIDAIFERYAY